MAARRIEKKFEAGSKRELAIELSNLLSRDAGVYHAWEGLSMLEQMVVTFVTLEGGTTTLSHLIASIGDTIDADGVRTALERLERFALVLRINESGVELLFAPPAVFRHVQTPPALRYGLNEILRAMKPGDINLLYDGMRSHMGPAPRGRLDRIIAEYLENPGNVIALVNSLSDHQREILDYILDAENHATLTGVRSRFYENGPRSSDPTFIIEGSDNIREIAGLLERGLVFSRNSHYDVKLVIPKEIRESIRGPYRLNWNFPGIKLDHIAVEGRSFDRYDRPAQDMAAFLAFVRRAKPSETRNGDFNKQDIRRAAKFMKVDSISYIALLAGIADSTHIIRTNRVREKRWAYEPSVRDRKWYEVTALADAYLSQPERSIKAEVLRAWVNLGSVNEFLVESDDESGYWAIPKRKCLLEILRWIPAMHAVNLDDVCLHALFRLPAAFAPALKSEDATGAIRDVVKTILMDYLFRLGVTEIAESSGEILVRVRDDAGDLLDAALSSDDTPVSVSDRTYDAQFVVQPNLEIIAGQHIHPLLFLSLCEFSDIHSYQQAIMLKISQDSVRSALDSGMSGKQIVDFLKNHSSSGVPQNVKHLIEDADERHGQIRIGKCESYLVVKDENVLRGIEGNKKLGSYIDRFLTERVAILKTDDYSDFLKELRSAGYMPVDDDDMVESKMDDWLKAIQNPPEMPQREESAADKPSWQSVVAGIDWQDMEKDDGLPYTVEPPRRPGVLGDKLTNRRDIKKLLEQAIELEHDVEVEYFSVSGNWLVRRIRPQKLDGMYMDAFCYTEHGARQFLVNNIAWVRRV
jgi:hypothetical protein